MTRSQTSYSKAFQVPCILVLKPTIALDAVWRIRTERRDSMLSMSGWFIVLILVILDDMSLHMPVQLVSSLTIKVSMVIGCCISLYELIDGEPNKCTQVE